MKALNVMIGVAMLTTATAWAQDAAKTAGKDGQPIKKTPSVQIMSFGSTVIRVATKEETDAACAVVSEWLKVIDDGKFQLAWDLSSPAFQKAAPKESWCGQLGDFRNSTVKVTSRKMVGHPVFHSQDGCDLLILHYETTFDAIFENGWSAVIETIVLVKDAKGWKPDGYFLKPQATAK